MSWHVLKLDLNSARRRQSWWVSTLRATRPWRHNLCALPLFRCKTIDPFSTTSSESQESYLTTGMLPYKHSNFFPPLHGSIMLPPRQPHVFARLACSQLRKCTHLAWFLLSIWPISSFLGGFQVFVAAFYRKVFVAAFRCLSRKLRQTPENPPKNDEIGQMDNRNQARWVYFLNFIQKSNILFHRAILSFVILNSKQCLSFRALKFLMDHCVTKHHPLSGSHVWLDTRT